MGSSPRYVCVLEEPARNLFLFQKNVAIQPLMYPALATE